MLDAEVLQHLPDEYKSRLVKFEKTFNTEGWKLVEEWAKVSADEAKDRVFLAATWDEALAWKGKWFAFTELAELEDSTYSQFEQIAKAAQLQAVQDLEIEYE